MKAKLRKRKRTKGRGPRGFDICKGCGQPNCDPIFSFRPSRSQRKINDRLSKGLCMGCGKEKDLCHCKSTE